MEPPQPSRAFSYFRLLDVGPKLQTGPLALCSCSFRCLSPDSQPTDPQGAGLWSQSVQVQIQPCWVPWGGTYSL